MTDSTNTTENATDVPASRSNLRTRLYRWTIYALIVIALAVLVWKILNESSMEQAHRQTLATLQEEQAAVLDARTRDLLRAMGQMIEPAVLKAMNEQDYADLDRRMQRLRRETPVERMYVTDPGGQVLFATGDRPAGMSLERELNALITDLTAPVIDEVGEGRLRLIAPVFEQSRKRGMIILMLQFAE